MNTGNYGVNVDESMLILGIRSAEKKRTFKKKANCSHANGEFIKNFLGIIV